MSLKHVRELSLSLNIYTFSIISSLTYCRDVSQIFISRLSEVLYTHEQICFENAYLRRIQQESDESHLSLYTASDRHKYISCALDRMLHKYPSSNHIHYRPRVIQRSTYEMSLKLYTSPSIHGSCPNLS